MNRDRSFPHRQRTAACFSLCISSLLTMTVSAQQQAMEGWSRRAEQAMRDGQADQAIKELDGAIQSMPNSSQLYTLRGSVKFRSGKVEESIPDFDKSIELDPQVKPYLWQRGIALYYADKFEEGLAQFEIHRDVNPNDVENAFWHFLCNAKLHGVEAAEKDVLLAGFDNRAPLMQVQQLIQGKLKIEEVIAASEKGGVGTQANRYTKFYGYLYVGLYYDVIKDPDNAKKYLQLCIDQDVPSYMGDVAKVHLEHLKNDH
jgi:lipoprotein NlpI